MLCGIFLILGGLNALSRPPAETTLSPSRKQTVRTTLATAGLHVGDAQGGKNSDSRIIIGIFRAVVKFAA